jgi:hypothetical protein
MKTAAPHSSVAKPIDPKTDEIRRRFEQLKARRADDRALFGL